jgi:large subunit ribosomal protein L9
MRVILTDDVVGLGDIGETVNVKPGYARNFLVPRGLAIEAESASAKVAGHRMRQIEAKKRRMKGSAEETANKLKSVPLNMELRVGEHGRVFGSIGVRDITQKLAENGYEFDRRRVMLAEPIRKIGTHAVRVRLHQSVEVVVQVNVTPREASKEEVAAAVDAAKTSLEEGADRKRAEEADDETEGAQEE